MSHPYSNSRKQLSEKERNAQIIEAWAKKDTNNHCAECKRNKQTKWASWNLGVFICMRCAGIHRGLGAHISKVKSTTLDTWTNEQVQTILRWGNKRANMYWEANLTPGHEPPEAKIENFIRTKYQSKRWIPYEKAPVPDPETLDDGRDDNVPLNIVQEKAKLAKQSSLRAASTPSRPVPPPPKADPPTNLIDGLSEAPARSSNILDDSLSPAAPAARPNDTFNNIPPQPPRPNTTDTNGPSHPPPKIVAPTKPANAPSSLLGNFMGPTPASTTARPTSSASTPAAAAEPSKKLSTQALMGLYRQSSKSQETPLHGRQPSTSATQSPLVQQQQTSVGGLGSSFNDLSIMASPPAPDSVLPAQTSSKADPFAKINLAAGQQPAAAPPKITSPLSNGKFFDQVPKPASRTAVAPPPVPKADPIMSEDFGEFSFASTPQAVPSKPAARSASNDLIGFSELTPPLSTMPMTASGPAKSQPVPSQSLNDVFNLSTPAPHVQSNHKSPPAPQPKAMNTSAFSNLDAFSSNAWATPEPHAPTLIAPKSKPAAAVQAPTIPMSNDFSTWNDIPVSSGIQPVSMSNGFAKPPQPAPKILPDEDFGDWGSAVPATPVATNPPAQENKPAGGGGGFGGGDDLFSNVWE